MPKGIVIYFSKSGNTKRMAELIAEGMKLDGISVVVKPVEETQVEELLDVEVVVIGSPTYYGTMAGEIKAFIDESVRLHGKLEGKVGGAFSSSGNIAGGGETTILTILDALLIHGMVIQGSPEDGHYGPVAIGKLDDRCKKSCVEFGRRMARLVRRVSRPPEAY